MTIYAVNGKEPIAAWIPSLDTAGNGTTTLTDLVGSNDGTLTNMDAATDWVSDTDAGGVRALDFDGSDETVIFGDVLDSVFVGDTATFTLSAWIYLASTGNCTVISKLGDTTTGGGNNRQFNFRCLDRDLDFVWFGTLTAASYRVLRAATKITLNQWTHVAVTFDANVATINNKAKIYINGVEQALTIPFSSGSPTYILDSSARLALAAGVGPVGGAIAYEFVGREDDCRIFDQVLDATDIAYLYNSGNGRGIVATTPNTRRRRYTGGYGL